MTDERRLEISLAIMRLTMAAFFLVWTLEKFVAPESTQGIFSHFYMTEISVSTVYIAGAVQLLLVLGFLLGIWKLATYGAILVMHGVSTLSTVGILVDPWASGTPNHLFWAGVPVLGMAVALFLLRDRDRWLTLGDGVSHPA
ncbi:MAG: DoxX protein [Alphaproteobacteria bacterium]